MKILPEDFGFLRKKLDLNQKEWGFILITSQKIISKYENLDADDVPFGPQKRSIYHLLSQLDPDVNFNGSFLKLGKALKKISNYTDIFSFLEKNKKQN